MYASPEEIAAFEKLALSRGGSVGGSVGRAPGVRSDQRNQATGTVHFHPVPGGRYNEDQFKDDVIDLARRCGWKALHFRRGRTAKGWRTPVQGDGKGFTDCIFVRERIVFAELKIPPNKLTPEQEAWRDWLLAAKQEWYCWRPEDWKTIEEALR